MVQSGDVAIRWWDAPPVLQARWPIGSGVGIWAPFAPHSRARLEISSLRLLEPRSGLLFAGAVGCRIIGRSNLPGVLHRSLSSRLPTHPAPAAAAAAPPPPPRRGTPPVPRVVLISTRVARVAPRPARSRHVVRKGEGSSHAFSLHLLMSRQHTASSPHLSAQPRKLPAARRLVAACLRCPRRIAGATRHIRAHHLALLAATASGLADGKEGSERSHRFQTRAHLQSVT